eukprot:1864720-Pyramimonas_sp.AAC.2
MNSAPKNAPLSSIIRGGGLRIRQGRTRQRVAPQNPYSPRKRQWNSRDTVIDGSGGRARIVRGKATRTRNATG